MRFGKIRAFESVPPPADVVAGAGALMRALPDALDLLPIPAASVVLEDGVLTLEATNASMRHAGLVEMRGTCPILDAIGDQIGEFLTSEDKRRQFPLRLGLDVDSLHYLVTLGRRTDAFRHRCLLTLVDQTSEHRTETSLRREMLTDSLTGLPNRAAFSDRLEALVAAGQQESHAVLVLDLDRFSRVNACMGALAGDELLLSVARRVKGALRARDVLARTGGDEFGILLSLDDGPSDAHHVARRIEGALGTPFRLSDFEIQVDCSIGIAFGADAIEEAEDLIRHAQFAVKRSKASGRAESYQTQAFDVAREQFGIETRLRRAIENGDLKLAFQPIWDLSTSRIVSFESLTRWTDEDGKSIDPNQFIPVAEESGLIVPLGRWAIDECARTLVEWDARAGGDCGVNVGVNLSAIQLHRDQIAPVVEAALDATHLPGNRFTLELTESALVTDPDRVAGTMRALKNLGATIAMDDFGTGYSNLAFLQKLPIDVLKIDRSFVTGMLVDRDKVSIVRAILSLATALGMKTTAEGIETNELAQTLAALGCTYGQGYLYAAPLASDLAYQLLQDRNG